MSANSGAEIYNNVIVAGNGPDGEPVRVQRMSQTLVQSSNPGPTNGSFDANAAGWSAVGGSIARDTTTFDTAPAAPQSALGFVDATIAWTPTTNRTGVTLRLSGNFPGTNPVITWWVDTVYLWVPTPTLVDRRGFRRSMIMQIQSALPSDGVASGALGDTWLAAHKTTPFRGSVTLAGDSALRNILTGADVPLEQLLLNVGELVRFSDRSDPDTGGHGRDGRIVQVSYQPATNSAQVTIDNSRTQLDALLARLAVIQGS